MKCSTFNGLTAAGTISLTSAATMALIALAGPLFLDRIHYLVTPATLNHIIAQDLVNLFLTIPLCLLGAFFSYSKDRRAKFCLIIPGLYMIYTGAALGLGQEWSTPDFQTQRYNSGRFFGLFLLLAINGLFLSFISITNYKVRYRSLPSKKIRKRLVALMGLLLLLFVFLWLMDISAAVNQGESLFNTSYRNSPTLFWLIKYFDLGFCVPLAVIALYQFIARPSHGYRLLLLYLGFSMLILPGTLLMRYLNGNLFTAATLVLFFNTLIIYSVFIFLIKHESHSTRSYC